MTPVRLQFLLKHMLMRSQQKGPHFELPSSKNVQVPISDLGLKRVPQRILKENTRTQEKESGEKEKDMPSAPSLATAFQNPAFLI